MGIKDFFGRSKAYLSQSFGKGKAYLSQKAVNTKQRIGNWRQARQAKKAAQPQIQPYGQVPASTPRFSFRQASKSAGIGIGILLFGAIVFFILNIIGAVSLVSTYILMPVIGIILAILLVIKRRYGLALIVFVLFAGIGYASWWLETTPLGKQTLGQIKETEVVAAVGTKSVAGPVNLAKQVFFGQYNPENLWRSDIAQSKYEQVEDVGVTLVDVKPLREAFNLDQQLSVQGKINAVAFPGTDISAQVSACQATTSGDCIKSWQCRISSSGNTIKARDARNRIFSCSSAPLCKEELALPIKVEATAKDTLTIAGKQLVVANPKAALALDNPLSSWGIDKDSLNSWRKGDESIDVGIGLSGEPDYLETDFEYFLGVNVENPSSHSGTAKLDRVDIFIPIEFSLSHSGEFKNCVSLDNDQKLATALRPLGLSVQQGFPGLQKCTATFGSEAIAPADRRAPLIGITLDRTKLEGQDFRTFFVLAAAKYDYSNSELLTTDIKRISTVNETICG